MATRKKWLAVVSLVIAATSFPNASDARTEQDMQQAADKAIRELERDGYTGSVLVAQDGNIKYFRDSGLANRPSGIPSYWIASITKQFVATGILLLHERKTLDIQDSFSDYLPDVPQEKSGITLFHLLTHTSGVPQRYAADGIKDRTAAVHALLATNLESAPGETFSYANDNYNLLAVILELQSGKTYEEFLLTEILLQTGMKNSGFWGMPIETGTWVPPVAVPFELDDLTSDWGFRGAVGMRASVHDMFAFMQALLGMRLLSEAGVELLMGNHLQLPSGTEIGFNWFGQRNELGIYSKSSRGHESFGGNAVIYYYPSQRLLIITATNAGPAETGDGPVEGWSRKTHAALDGIFVAD